MRQTIAQALIQEGHELGYAEGRKLGYTEAAIQIKQEDLMTLLQAKFGQLPPNIVERIQGISEIDRLNTLFHQSLLTSRLEEIEIE